MNKVDRVEALYPIASAHLVAYIKVMLIVQRNKRQTRIGVGLAMLVVVAWFAIHVYAVFFLPLNRWGLTWAVPIILVLTWLNVGLFIIAHDAMHGSLAPGHPRLNRAIGRMTLLLYAGFWMDRLLPEHFKHHRHAGTEKDPDFLSSHPTGFWRWYGQFFRHYFGLREFVVLHVLVWSYILVLGARPSAVGLFWGVPAILSSLQLFYFGTFRPHRREEAPFTNDHRARSNEYSWLASLLTCFHFGYHNEHHLSPGIPWWGLPGERQRRKAEV